MMQRSYSSNSFEGNPGFLFQPRFDSLLESPNYQGQALSLPENNFLAGHLRRVCSTGDLQNINKTPQTKQRSFSSPLATESSFVEDSNFKAGRYSAEERKERISKYRAKPDNRPRIRGRFARNEEIGEIPKVACSTEDEDEEQKWFDGLHEEEDDGAVGGSSGGFAQPQLHYYGGY
ncbi:ZINC FINGER PROTEIN CONSTANS-LIKE 4 [Salix viminalis]|uniref:ZINC FINGER PROTEIN CONSTANS-LIKE 4 n=1 Tax=Salix viminalis TaxID=40686 RepID=A0A9Q0TMJ2_SALVM|nr:ZINC FINGER PROTEIN CONSTANS-LIKE 4 [Salix viminalis]